MLSFLKRFAWFEWFWVGAAIAGMLTVVNFINKYSLMTRTISEVTVDNKIKDSALKEEKRSGAITNQIVFDYSFDRELVIRDTDQLRYQTRNAYFNARDTVRQIKKEDIHDDATSVNVLTATETPNVVDTDPDPAALAALANGMLNTYCRVYSDPATCTTQSTAK